MTENRDKIANNAKDTDKKQECEIPKEKQKDNEGQDKNLQIQPEKTAKEHATKNEQIQQQPHDR